MGQALYRKYRSRSLAEIVGQEHITQALANALKDGHISHAYLLTGPRGVGKTSIARILAHEINQLPYDDDETMHLDIIEIDAASNNGVEDVRDLREKVLLAPAHATFKVYIIDEVHMLSGAAFNALLKTLEEPPAHVVFILATTEVHKLPATIISRTQRFQFSPVSGQKVIAHLRTIANKEKIKISDEALALVAAHGDGAFRDSISLLDQLRSVTSAEISTEDVEATLGSAPGTAIAQLLDYALAGNVHEVTAAYDLLVSKGISPTSLAVQLMQAVRHRATTNPLLYALIDQLIDVPRAYSPRIKLEVVLATFALQNNTAAANATPASAPPAPATKSATTPKKEKPVKPLHNPIVPTPVPVPIEEETSPAEQPDELPETAQPTVTTPAGNGPLPELTDDHWQQIVEAAKTKGPTLYTVVRQAIPYFDADKQLLTITFRFPLHQKRFEETRYKQEFSHILQTVLGSMPTVQVVLNKNAVRHIKPAAQNTQEVHDVLPEGANASSVINLMGGGEVVNV